MKELSLLHVRRILSLLCATHLWTEQRAQTSRLTHALVRWKKIPSMNTPIIPPAQTAAIEKDIWQEIKKINTYIDPQSNYHDLLLYIIQSTRCTRSIYMYFQTCWWVILSIVLAAFLKDSKNTQRAKLVTSPIIKINTDATPISVYLYSQVAFTGLF